MAKKLQNIEAHESFRLGLDFSVKEMGPGEEGTDEVIVIEGYANFAGDCSDNASCFIDRTNDVVVPTGIDVANYKKSPVVLFQHNRDYVIGKALTVTKKKDGLFIKAELHAGAMDDEDFYAIKNGLYTSFSIGFRTKAGEFRDVNGTDVFFITKSELLEVSVVSIPCNTNSTFNLVKSFEGNIYAGDFEYRVAPAGSEINKALGEDVVKLKLKDLLPEDKVKELQALGLTEELEALKEVDTKSFIEALVAKEVKAAVKAAMEELVTKNEETAEAATEEVVTEEAATETATEEPVVEEPAGEEAANEEEKQLDVETIKSMSDDIAKLIALASAE